MSGAMAGVGEQGFAKAANSCAAHTDRSSPASRGRSSNEVVLVASLLLAPAGCAGLVCSTHSEFGIQGVCRTVQLPMGGTFWYCPCRDVLLQAPRSSLPLPSEQQATKRALTKRSLWVRTCL